MITPADRQGFALPINRLTPDHPRRPKRLHRIRGRRSTTPQGAVYVGRPTTWSNPFGDRPGIGHARSVILYRAWVSGQTTPHILVRAGFSEAEVESLHRWRSRLLERLATLAGKDLQCWCPLTSAWCHADVLLSVANP